MSASAANTRTLNHVARRATSTEQTRTDTLMLAVLNAIYRNPKLSQIYHANLKARKPCLSRFVSNEVRRNYDTYPRLQDSNGREQEITAVQEHTELLDEELMEELKHTADERIIQIAMEDGGDFSETYKQEAPATNTHAQARPIHADERETVLVEDTADLFAVLSVDPNTSDTHMSAITSSATAHTDTPASSDISSTKPYTTHTSSNAITRHPLCETGTTERYPKEVSTIDENQIAIETSALMENFSLNYERMRNT
ncbi:hypothetical protein B484DRAFT_423185 [Ochromonadaceae sp. CCMP2298]|nr:hypothetical protein B484DRAFT_423185 [Ochromonadaceae sp. CCMP2298]